VNCRKLGISLNRTDLEGWSELLGEEFCRVILEEAEDLDLQ